MSTAIATTSLPYPLLRRGKVRDVYDVGEDRLLIVATDRISAFDVVMNQPIPSKGAVLTAVTRWWLEQEGPFSPNHLLLADYADFIADYADLKGDFAEIKDRSMLVRRTQPLAFECVVRGYISGSAWSEYKSQGTLAGEGLPRGLRESDR